MSKNYKEENKRTKDAYEKENEFLKSEVIGAVKENETSKQNSQTQMEKATEK